MRFISSSRNRRLLRITVLLAAASVVIPLEALLLPDVLDTRPACVRAEEWVRAHAGSLPTLYDQLISYPMAHRRAIFGNLTPEIRAGLWRENLSRFAAERDLTPDQRDFVEWCKRDVITTENYRRGGPEKAVIAAAHDGIEARFLDEEDRRAFVQLGPTEPRLTSIEGARLGLAERLQAAFAGRSSRIVHAQTTYGTCTCNVENAGYYWWECGSSGQYYCRANGCTPWNACGLFGFFNCDGCCCWFQHPEFCNC